MDRTTASGQSHRGLGAWGYRGGDPTQISVSRWSQGAERPGRPGQARSGVLPCAHASRSATVEEKHTPLRRRDGRRERDRRGGTVGTTLELVLLTSVAMGGPDGFGL
jgi:hypothetical protein